MARQRRGTSAILGRLSSVIGTIVLIHVVARLIHMWGFMARYDYRVVPCDSYDDCWQQQEVPITFWSMDERSFEGGWLGIIMVHVLAAVAVAITVGIFFALRGAFRWLFFEPEYGPECSDRGCPCIEHRGMVFYEDGQCWDYPSSGPSAGTVAVVAAAAATASMIASS